MAKKESTPTEPDAFQAYYLANPGEIQYLTEEAKQDLWPAQLKELKEKAPDINSDELDSLNEPQAQGPLVHSSSSPSIEETTTVTEDNSVTTTSVDPPGIPSADSLIGSHGFPEGEKLQDMGEGTPTGVFSTPKAGSRVWIFFYGGDVQKPVYFAQCIPPTEYKNHYGNSEPVAGESNSSLPPVVINPTTGKEDVIPIDDTAAAPLQTRSISNDTPLSQYTGTLQEQMVQADKEAENQLPEWSSQPPTAPSQTSVSTVKPKDSSSYTFDEKPTNYIQLN